MSLTMSKKGSKYSRSKNPPPQRGEEAREGTVEHSKAVSGEEAKYRSLQRECP
jgi:hypothetical protein